MRLIRVGIALGLAVAGLAWSGPAAVPLLRTGGSDFPALLAGTVCVVHAVVSAWLLVAVLVLASGRVPRGTPRWLAPRWLLVALVVGGGLAPSPASADPADHLSGLPLPDRAATTSLPLPPEAAEPAPPALPGPLVAHVVVPGDTLWSVARDRLPGGASDATVTAAVERWHSTNRAVIGADPDLLQPGQVLTSPQEPAS